MFDFEFIAANLNMHIGICAGLVTIGGIPLFFLNRVKKPVLFFHDWSKLIEIKNLDNKPVYSSGSAVTQGFFILKRAK